MRSLRFDSVVDGMSAMPACPMIRARPAGTVRSAAPAVRRTTTMFEYWTRHSAVALLLPSFAGCGGGTGAFEPPPGPAAPAITSFRADRTVLHVGERAEIYE
jgi:hypothetical protein